MKVKVVPSDYILVQSPIYVTRFLKWKRWLEELLPFISQLLTGALSLILK